MVYNCPHLRLQWIHKCWVWHRNMFLNTSQVFPSWPIRKPAHSNTLFSVGSSEALMGCCGIGQTMNWDMVVWLRSEAFQSENYNQKEIFFSCVSTWHVGFNVFGPLGESQFTHIGFERKTSVGFQTKCFPSCFSLTSAQLKTLITRFTWCILNL